MDYGKRPVDDVNVVDVRKLQLPDQQTHVTEYSDYEVSRMVGPGFPVLANVVEQGMNYIVKFLTMSQMEYKSLSIDMYIFH